MNMVFEDFHSFNDNYMIEHVNESAKFADIKGYVSKIFNKNKAFKEMFNRFKKAANPVLKRSLALAMLLMLNTNTGEKSAANAASSLVDKEHEITVPEDFIELSKELVASDATNIKPIEQKKNVKIPDDYEGMSEKEMIKLGLIEPVFKVDRRLIGLLNRIHPNRFSEASINRYNKYDKDIGLAVAELKEMGEKPNPTLIKSIMFIETHMNPRRNRLGFEGFPQTKMKHVNWVNQGQGQNFTFDDLYDAKESAKLIHFFFKQLQQRYDHINDVKTAAIGYNWGAGNYRKYKKRIKKKMPHETQIYVKLLDTILKNAPKNV